MNNGATRNVPARHEFERSSQGLRRRFATSRPGASTWFKRLKRPSFDQFFIDENDAASVDLGQLTPQRALIRFYQRHELVFEQTLAASGQSLACRAGCSHCCNFKVEVTGPEMIGIAGFVRDTFSAERIDAVRMQARLNADAASTQSYAQQRASNQACPFLLDRSCSVYEVRPAMCRNFHATDVQGCIDSVNAPANAGRVAAGIESVVQAGHGTTQGFRQAAREAGVDARLYDLDSAFLEAMDEPLAVAQRLPGEPSFRLARQVGIRDESV